MGGDQRADSIIIVISDDLFIDFRSGLKIRAYFGVLIGTGQEIFSIVFKCSFDTLTSFIPLVAYSVLSRWFA